ncbi:MAG: acyl-CoA dehydrogenase family protein [Flavobacteriaceae bacterium]|nr:acyl-CoA dehydrogenase family protein [Flavobacteriaceae bacterium]MBL6678284.1 acyl-CoA dehydrogenase family protein [Flavobacteriaceae bacterium]
MPTKNKTKLKGGEFILKESLSDEIFTPEDFSEEQLMMKETIIDFMDREIWPDKMKYEEKNYDLTVEAMKKIGELGLLGVSLEEKYGGMGMDFVSTMLAVDYVSGVSGSVATAYGAHTGIAILPIYLFGNEDQKQKYLPKLASGEWFGSYCLTEPTAGSDANSGKTKAELSNDGKHYKINGQKMWISNAGFANLFIVFARIEDDKNITAFIVPNEADNGIKLGEEEKKLGIHSSSTRQVFFTDTIVPVENLLGERNGGFKIAMNALNVGRIKLGAGNLDGQRRSISISTEYANNRVQFKQPISSFGAIKEKLASMATSCYAGESACYRAASDVQSKIDEYESSGLTKQESELKGVEEFAVECSILKVAISEDMQICADEGVQIFGGMGFSAEAPIESAWRDARIGRIYEGTNEINRMLSIGMILKKAMKGELDIMSAYQDIIENKSQEIIENSDELNDEITLVENMKKVFLLLLGKSFEKFGPEIDKNQQVLLSLSDLAIETYISESTLKRTVKNIKRTSTIDQEYQISMSKLYIYEAAKIIEKKSRDIINSIIDGDNQENIYSSISKKLSYTKNPNIFELKTHVADKIIAENKYCF